MTHAACPIEKKLHLCAQAFMDKYSPEATPFTKHPEKYVRFSVADVRAMIAEELFEGRERELGGGLGARSGAAAALVGQLSKLTDASA
jgi:hypothetical protein